MSRLPRFEPMLASTGPLPPDPAGLAVEPKWDGFRCIAFLNDAGGPSLRAYSRSGRPLADAVPELRPLAEAVGCDAVLDGELIVADAGGRPDFYALSRRMLATASSPLASYRRLDPVTFVVFDVLWLAGSPLVSLPYTERRARLEELALVGPSWLTCPSYRAAEVDDVLAACAAFNLEGVIVKAESSVYEERRSRWWVTMCRRSRRRLPCQGQRSIRV